MTAFAAVSELISNILGIFSELVFPRICVGCSCDLPSGSEGICTECAGSLLDMGPRCSKCASRIGPHVPSEKCPVCRKVPSMLTGVIAVGDYDGFLREMILGLKYQGRITLADPLSLLMSSRAVESGSIKGTDVIVPVPLCSSRQRVRGYNQSVLLAEAVGCRCGVKTMSDVLVRRGTSRPQTGLARRERLVNLRGVFAVVSPEKIAGLSILLVDDVMTTGSTLRECARILRKSGAGSVSALVAARD